jgi:large subunit ribosomal protein L1
MTEKKKDKKQKAVKSPFLVGGKKYRAVRERIDSNKLYDLPEAMEIIHNNKVAKFDETVEFVIKLGVNPVHSDQIVRGVVSMPNGIGKKVRVAAFVKEEKVDEALKAGADLAGSDNIIEDIKAGTINFDVCIATPDMMPKISSVAKILGPKGLMPNPKLGTVTTNIEQAIQLAKAGQVEFRVEKAGIVHTGIGKVSFTPKALVENAKALYDAVVKAKPSGAKGVYVKGAFLSSTMGPSLKVNLVSLS